MRLQVTPRRPLAHSMASQRHRSAWHHKSTLYAPTPSFQNLSNAFSPALTACLPYIKVQTAENLYFWAVHPSTDATGYSCRRFAVECVWSKKHTDSMPDPSAGAPWDMSEISRLWRSSLSMLRRIAGQALSSLQISSNMWCCRCVESTDIKASSSSSFIAHFSRIRRVTGAPLMLKAPASPAIGNREIERPTRAPLIVSSLRFGSFMSTSLNISVFSAPVSGELAQSFRNRARVLLAMSSLSSTPKAEAVDSLVSKIVCALRKCSSTNRRRVYCSTQVLTRRRLGLSWSDRCAKITHTTSVGRLCKHAIAISAGRNFCSLGIAV